MKESDLFEPVKKYLEKQGYSVRSEVLHCDITATKGDELVVIELKKQFGIKLLTQAVTRQEAADSVYVAVPVSGSKKVPPNFKGICRLLKRLELGLILVRFLKSTQRVEIVFHPSEYTKRRNLRGRRSLIREIEGRYKNFNTGGAPGSVKRITAYKQAAIQVACFLNLMGEASPAELKRLGTEPRKTGSILLKNHYGWFEKLGRGRYSLHPEGRNALKAFPEMTDHFGKIFKEQK